MFREQYILAQATPETTDGAEATSTDGAAGTTAPGGTPPGGTPAGKPAPNPLGNPLFGFLIVLVVFYLVLFMGRGKKQKKYDEMLKNLRKNDRVVTIGGIVGTVVSAKEDEVVLKVDESNNTKMTFVRRAIQNVVSEDHPE